MTLLEVRDIRTRYGAIEALKGISLTVDEGEVVTLIGSNGAGKSTTLRSISGLTPASQGTITFAGEEITRVPAHEIVSRGIALAPEGRHCFIRMTVRENLELGAHRRRGPEITEDHVRGRAADARDRARPDGPAEAADARRAVARHRP